MAMNNPWTSLLPNNKVATIDEVAMKALQAKYNDCFNTQIWPEPFIGDPKANVYLLGGNPGLSQGAKGDYTDEVSLTDDSILSKIIEDNLNHRISSNINPFTYPVSSTSKKHPGEKWWRRKISSLMKELGLDFDKDKLSIFDVEFFPYHSTNTAGIDMKDLIIPSSAYTNQLIREAMGNNKLIVIIRKYKAWIERIPELENYGNLLILSDYQNNSLTKGNLIDPVILKKAKESGWDRLTKELRQTNL